ncbi:3-ketodihydrosphingosine reductase isoform X2 [Anabrus simplex]|uniref:3-ketodihydrosphingosine reductase isoform X2 n=1 Tax=Anabrus simplex TaxID=316456 RepID=UPI0035A38EDB
MLFQIVIVAAILACLFVIKQWLSSRKQTLDKKHVVITGGSSGIGKSVAIEVARMGANVTLIARDVQKLESAKLEVTKNCLNPDHQIVQYISLDVGDNYDAVEKALHAAEDDMGPIYLLVNCAGMAICGRLEDTSVSDIKCKPYNVSVTLALPPDTDTPGFANEEKTKPLETRLISQSAGLLSPQVVAKQLIKDTMDGNFYSTVGFESFLLKILCAGMAPVSSLSEFILQVMLMGLFRAICVGYLISFHRIIRNCMKTRDKTKKSE